MKKLLLLTIFMSLLLCGCGQEELIPPQPTTAPVIQATTAPTEEPTTVPTTEPAPVYINPLTGVEVEEPFTSRPFAFTIGNNRESFPHYGVSKCDILFEAFVNGLTTRRFAMFTNIQNVESIGGVRSMRVQWTDLCQGYDAIGVHAAGSNYVMGDMRASGIDNINGDQWNNSSFHYRDQERIKQGYSMEHCLYEMGPELLEYAKSIGMTVTTEPDKDYGMRFSETPSSLDGQTANELTVNFKLSRRQKPTILTYDPSTKCYQMAQYENIPMVDGYYNNEPELYKNIFALLMPYHTESGIYHVCDSVGQGEGFFACEGKVIPIFWSRETNESPFTFTLTDGSPLLQGIGSSYIALATKDSEVFWDESSSLLQEFPEETQPKVIVPVVDPTETYDPADLQVDD